MSEAWRPWPAPAKLNLFLRILGRRADGYHDLQTVFQLLDWGDTVHLRVRADGRILRHGAAPWAGDPAADLVVRAANRLREATGSRLGADIRVDKQVPIGGGFGGGSSDAATVLVALNALWGCGLDDSALAEIGRTLGADVPVFVRGRSAWAEGVGEHLVPLDLPPAWYLIVDSGVSVSTAELFQCPDLTRNQSPATISDFLAGRVSGNAFQSVLCSRAPAVAELLDVLSAVGQARLTGTGGGVFVGFATREAAEAARLQVAGRFRGLVVAGVDRSPLHRALEGAGLG